VLEADRVHAAVPGPGSLALLADPMQATPRLAGLGPDVLALMPAALGPHPFEPATPEQTAGEPLYVLGNVAGAIALAGRSYEILETKERQKDGSPRLLAVRLATGEFVTDPPTIASVLLAHAVRSRLASIDMASLASALSEDASFLAALTDQPDTLPLVEAASGGPQSLSDEQLLSSVDAALAHIELHRTRVVMLGLEADLSDLDASSDDGDLFLSLYSRLDWLLARLDAVHSLAQVQAQVPPPWSGSQRLLSILDPGRKPAKAEPRPSGPGVELEATAAALSGPGATGLASLLASGMLPSISLLSTTTVPGAWIGLPTLLASAAEAASRSPRMAPPPDTEVKKYSFSNGVLTIVPSGTDEDGRVAGYRWWFDDDKDQHVIKGNRGFKAPLTGLKSGSHDVFVAALDDDGQRDPTAARLAFYVRRSVDLKTQSVEIAFDAEPWNVNSEHVRAIKTFVRELEGPVMECADEHYRFGIDGSGRVTLTFSFSEDKVVAHSADASKDTFKNKALASCIEKTVKQPRLHHDQDYRPGAAVSVTFAMKPYVLFFDATSLGDAPGPDVMGATLWSRCTDKALRKIEAFCDAAVRSLPGPGDTGEPGGGDAEAGQELEETDEEEGEEIEEDLGDKVEEPAAEPIEKVVIPPPEFDAIEVHAQCVASNVDILISNCRVHLTKKRLWCVDSCQQLAKKCAKKCKKAADWSEDPFSCRETCWADEALSCAESCALKNTPLAKSEEPASE
jgi:hypothetical protein